MIPGISDHDNNSSVAAAAAAAATSSEINGAARKTNNTEISERCRRSNGGEKRKAAALGIGGVAVSLFIPHCIIGYYVSFYETFPSFFFVVGRIRSRNGD